MSHGGIFKNKFGLYCVPHHVEDPYVVKTIKMGQVYEPHVVDFIRANVTGKKVVHAGAYFGDFLPALSQAAERVFAFEPNPDSYTCACETIRLNALGNVTFIEAGLGEKEEAVGFSALNINGDKWGGCARILPNRYDTNIRVVPLDMYTRREDIALIHLDVEGYEGQALRGAINTIERSKPILVLEDWADNTLYESEWFVENILGLGYRPSLRLGGNQVFVC